MKPAGYFVTGTGTGVGKTFVTAALARAAVSRGTRVFAFKPIETGCLRVDGRRVGEDQEILAVAAGGWQQGRLRNLYCLERPLAPLAAADAEQVSIDLDLVESTYRVGAAGAGLVLVEGAGGWRVPITLNDDMSSLARRLALPILVVGTASLGTINHTVLTVEAVLADGGIIGGIVLSTRPTDDLDLARANLREIERLTGRRAVLCSEPMLDVSALGG